VHLASWEGHAAAPRSLDGQPAVSRRGQLLSSPLSYRDELIHHRRRRTAFAVTGRPPPALARTFAPTAHPPESPSRGHVSPAVRVTIGVIGFTVKIIKVRG